MLEPHKFLMVYASGKNRTNPAFNLHTNFKLSSSPGYLGLSQDIVGGLPRAQVSLIKP